MKVDKPEWFKGVGKESHFHTSDFGDPTKHHYCANSYFATKNAGTPAFSVDTQLRTDNTYSPANLKEFGLACYHLGLYLEQQNK